MRSDQADQLPLSDRLTIVQRHVPPTPPTPPPGEDVEHPVGQQARVHNDATMVMMMMMMMMTVLVAAAVESPSDGFEDEDPQRDPDWRVETRPDQLVACAQLLM